MGTKSNTFSVDVSPAFRDQLDAICKRKGMSRDSIVITGLQYVRAVEAPKEELYGLSSVTAIALALLNKRKLSQKEGRFCANLLYRTSPLSDKQAKWLRDLLERHIPHLVEDSEDAPELDDSFFERGEIRKGDKVIRPASGTLTKQDDQCLPVPPSP